jgi:hypothetical protein
MKNWFSIEQKNVPRSMIKRSQRTGLPPSVSIWEVLAPEDQDLNLFKG